MARQRIVFNDGETGQETLRRMASVDRYNSWIYSRLRPYLGQRILEVGCGLGNMTGYFLDRERVVALDRLRESVEMVADMYRDQPSVQCVEGDICDAELVARLGPHQFDTAVCINVLEHIENDALAIRMMARAVGHGGRVIVLAPACPSLYGSLDIGLGHYRRYRLSALSKVLEAVGCEIEDAFHMNVAGIPGWFLNSRILKRRLLPRKMLGLFNCLTPIFCALEQALNPPCGLSVVVVARVRAK